jgi:hypothetical protein
MLFQFYHAILFPTHSKRFTGEKILNKNDIRSLFRAQSESKIYIYKPETMSLAELYAHHNDLVDELQNNSYENYQLEFTREEIKENQEFIFEKNGTLKDNFTLYTLNDI